MIKRIVLAAVFTVSIPVFGFLVGTWILQEFYAEAPQVVIEMLCQDDEVVSSDAQFRAACIEYNQVKLLRNGSVWTGGVAVALMLLYFVLSVISGRNRWLNAAIFPKLVPLSSLIIAGLILAEGAILTYGAYIGEVYAIERVHFWVIGTIGIGAVIGAYKMIEAMLSMKSDVSQPAFGKEMSKDAAPTIWDFVGDIAKKLGARTPDNIIVGLEPTFYATGAKVTLVNEGKELKGETLYLSLPLMRLFNADELRAVVGHELGHFRGGDTAYTLKFAPVYNGLGKSLAALHDEEGGLTSLAKLPAISMLSLMIEMFSRNERRIGRDREFEADNAGVSVSSPSALATSLGKIAVYAPLWDGIRENNIDRLNEGKVTSNLSQVYEDSARFDISHRDAAEIMEQILQAKIAHPIDTHPAIAERYKNIGFEPDTLTLAALMERGNTSSEFFENLHKIEEELTLHEHRLVVALGAVKPLAEEEEGRKSDTFLNAMYALAAAMVGADGKIEQSEIKKAEVIGSQMFGRFDAVEFRACCNNLDSLPAFKDVVSILAAPLKDEHKSMIYDYLKDIAMVDGELAAEEKEFLVYVREQWRLEIQESTTGPVLGIGPQRK